MIKRARKLHQANQQLKSLYKLLNRNDRNLHQEMGVITRAKIRKGQVYLINQVSSIRNTKINKVVLN
ncbi:hypothetical protein FGO68_gene16780 [Halteria grandinella]|uniref:Uncharacterized protein n=1 Tax=Halteria grandinella TaxID=5974 RepID=A0A8J8TAS6_HALGN|nr:hypothetical protein FGO68_gene16780 [Halteria grandinella]